MQDSILATPLQRPTQGECVRLARRDNPMLMVSPWLVCLSVRLPVYLPACRLSGRLPACFSAGLPACLLVCLPVCWSACLSAGLPSCLPTRQLIHLQVGQLCGC